MANGGGRDELARTLRALRAAARLTQTEAGRRAGLGQHSVSRVERGLYRPTADEAAALATAYGASEADRRRVRELADELKSEVVPARVILSRGAASYQQRIGQIEAESRHIRAFHPTMVHGLLQTEAYIRVIFARGDVDATEAERAVAARLDRQRILDDPDHRFTFIQSEGALRWQLGSAALMAEQLDHIARWTTRAEHVRVGLIPWTTPAPMGVLHGFHLYDRRAVTVGTKTAHAIMTEEYDLAVYEDLFTELERLALFGADAATLAHRIAAEYRALP
ncbi:DUF5753 domain-containing protein [Pseudonocardia acaciae]|uniref:DUF5753 domain-containing protein n=1 Tax=Pseudonocardia acaciae TaxID=551276 RepID=UPI0004905E29|nr:DUF5753 domain-containing protein [Pseudonocardia acaciae]